MISLIYRSDGAAAIIVGSTGYVKNIEDDKNKPEYDVLIKGGGESSGPLYPPYGHDINTLNEDIFSCEDATNICYREANLTCSDIDWFGLYDCFPVTLIRAIEAIGLCETGHGGQYIEKFYNQVMETGVLDQNEFPINTHGGLLAFGAPWETPCFYSIIEAVQQISGNAGDRQVTKNQRGVRNALIYGNGGIFSHSSTCILSKPVS